MPEFISIGAIGKAHGINGQFYVIALSDDPEQYRELKSVYLNFKGTRTICAVENIRFTHDRILLKLEGIDDRSTLESHRGALLERERHELRPLSEDEYFIFDLIGLTAKTVQGERIGKLTDILNLPAHDVYVIRNEAEEILIPAISNFIRRIDLKQGEVIVDPIDGLLD